MMDSNSDLPSADSSYSGLSRRATATSTSTSFNTTNTTYNPSPGTVIQEYLRRRVSTFRYIISVYSGKSHYFGTVLLTPAHLNRVVLEDPARIKKRIARWFNLGMRTGTLLGIPNAGDYVRAFSSLIAEYELEVVEHPSTRDRMKRMFTGKSSRNSTMSEHSVATQESANSDANQDLHHMPFEFDYSQTLFAFFEIMAAAYEKFLDSPDAVRNQTYVDIWLKIDGKIKKIVAHVLKEIEVPASMVLQEELLQMASEEI
ncbi:hypothetical protein HKX48_002699 [Thoreauomyces humboldtii]|nr:hypothetical protein HKX48_002699 [Thoreauomyces humboldtii]